MSVVESNVVADTGSMEIDLVLYNSRASLQFIENILLVECKNWNAPVDCKAIRDFIQKIRSARLTTGILIAANGITGEVAAVTNARDVLRQAFDLDGVKVFVITRAHLEAFRSIDEVINFFRASFAKIILRKNTI